MKLVRRIGTLGAVATLALFASAAAATAQTHTSKPFTGAKVNGGTVTHMVENGKHVLTLSGDFKVPDTPDPHWQVVDSRGRVFLLQRLPVKGLLGIGKDKITMSITLPSYIDDVAKVQIYCAWAEAVLGETTFDMRITTTASR
jgi:hypothetical protein